jgi:putative methanogenesis marker protein 8
MSVKLEKFLEKIVKNIGRLPDDLHITRKAGALVALSEGKVILIEKPLLKYCPLLKEIFKEEAISKQSIKGKFEIQKKDYGNFSCDRITVNDEIMIPFGASEIMMYALKNNLIDAAVLVCEGAGTVVSSNPSLVQGIGANMNGIFYTSPITEIINNIKKNGGLVLSPENAAINQYEGAKLAIDNGFKKIAVTVRGDESGIIKEIKQLEKQNEGCIDIIIFAVCNSGINKGQTRILKKYADIVWACASKNIREIVGPDSIIQLGTKVPVFILTKKGAKAVFEKSSHELIDKIKNFEKKHYISLKNIKEGRIKVKLGDFYIYLYQTQNLPLYSFDEPYPLF